MTKRKNCVSLQMRFVITSLLAAPALMPPLYAQQNLTWDANNAGSGTGGSGTWDTSSPNWLNGASFQAWQNPTFDNAILGGTAGNITLSMPIAAHNITFRTDGYTISGSTLTLGGGTRPTIFVHAPVAIINSTLAGTDGFIKNASGTLILTADNTGFSGVATVILGTLRVDNANALGVSTAASDLVLSKGTTFHFNSDFVHDYTLIGDTVNVQGGEGKTWDGSPILTASTTLNLNGIGGT